jgi:hypothetical protein
MANCITQLQQQGWAVSPNFKQIDFIKDGVNTQISNNDSFDTYILHKFVATSEVTVADMKNIYVNGRHIFDLIEFGDLRDTSGTIKFIGSKTSGLHLFRGQLEIKSNFSVGANTNCYLLFKQVLKNG